MTNANNSTTIPEIFTNPEFGSVRVLTINDEPWFVGKDVAEALGYSNTRDAIAVHVEECDKIMGSPNATPSIKDSMGRKQFPTFINESGVYSLTFGSKLESAKRFKHWVTSEVLPTIRKTGGYVHNDDLFISTYLPFADEATKALFRTTLLTIREQNQLITTQKNKISAQESVITTLTKDVSLADLRHILNRLMRHHGGNFQNRWQLLYREFEHKYSMNLSVRLQNYSKRGKKKITSKLDYIDKVLNQLPDLYDLAAKIFESDLKELINELYEARGLKND